MRALKWSVVTLLAVVGVGCGPAKVEPGISLSASPRTINGTGGSTTITVTAVDDVNKPGTGTVRITSPAGSLTAGTEVDLLAGEGSVMFTCDRSVDPACTGSIRITGEWVFNGTKNTATTNVTVSGATDAGTDGGSGDAGIDAGVQPNDAGVLIVVTSSKPALVAGTGDNATITATLSDSVGPLANEQVSFTTSSGTFVGGLTTATATTDATGKATIVVRPGATNSSMTITAEGAGGQGSITLNAIAVASVTYITPTMGDGFLVVRNAGGAAVGASMINVSFKVVDANQMGVENVDINFSLVMGSAAGATITPSARTDVTGTATATLTSGESNGTVTVRATLAATEGSASLIAGTSAGIPVLYGVPSAAWFSFQCSRKNLGALHNDPLPPTRLNVSTGCTVTVGDRVNTPIPGRLTLRFLTETGMITGTTLEANNGVAQVTLDVGNATNLPLDVPALPGEPTNGSKNPRDMLVSILAVAQGEEEFIDGSANGTRNGKWDPGEWYVDQGEPYLDLNDNNQHDSNEPHFDVVGGTPMFWDGPNGKWDENTLIGVQSRVVLTGPVSQISFSPAPPWNVGAAPFNVDFIWGDQWLNPSSPDSAGASATLLPSGIKGQVTISAGGFGGDDIGMPITYAVRSVTESAPDSGVFTVGATCPSGPPATMPLQRCMRRIEFGAGWSGGTHGSLTLSNASGPSAAGQVRIEATHSFTASPGVANAAVNFALMP